MTRAESITAVLAAATRDIGTEEQPRGSNDGIRVRHMLANAGVSFPAPWCAAAVTTWGIEALGKGWPLPRTADCDVLLAFARAQGILLTPPAVGDVFLRLKSPRDAVHTGVVSAVNGNAIGTVEGNTAADGGREGHACLARHRSTSEPLVFVRWANLLSEVPAWRVRFTDGALWPQTKEVNGRVFVPARLFVSRVLGTSSDSAPVMWRDNAFYLQGSALFAGDALQSQDGVTWAHIGAIGRVLGFSAVADSPNRIVQLTRP